VSGRGPGGDPRSAIPAIDRLLGDPAFAPLVDAYGRARAAEGARASVSEARARIADGTAPPDVGEAAWYADHALRWLEAEDVPSLRKVVNATGVVLHTNLGRAPLARVAIEAMDRIAPGYGNLEFDLEAGRRGSRYVHCVSLLRELTGAEDALVVNNAAAGLLLSLNTVALGRGVAVSRGELVEIGGGFRIPEILERSGARLVEVGSTNRTRLGDYRSAVEPDPEVGPVGAATLSALLKVHRSNFRVVGFTEEAALDELVALGAEVGLPVVYDLGSGLMIDPSLVGLPDEPRPSEAVAAGADLVVFSGDKLLGGPQTGIVVGRRTWIERLRKNPLCRALRVDKTTLAALEATLRLYRDPARAVVEIPTLALLARSADLLEARAERLAAAVREGGGGASVVPVRGAVGGGTYPGVELASWAVAPEWPGSADAAARALRAGTPPVVGRIVDDRLVLDVRTLLDDDEGPLVGRVLDVAGARRHP